MSTITQLMVARAVDPGGARNAADTIEIIIDRVETYFRNETFSEMNRPKPVDDPFGVTDRDLVPLDIDRVKLYAVVWAKQVGDAEFQPFCGDGFDNDGNFFRAGSVFGPDMGESRKQAFGEEPEANPAFKLGLMRRATLDPAVPRLLPWPWQDLELEWEEFDYKATSRKIGDKTHRTYSYSAGHAITDVATTDGWTLDLPMTESGRLPLGVRRFRVKINALPEGLRLSRKRRARELVSVHDRSVNRGFALRLAVRSSAVPPFSEKNDAKGIGPRSKALEESLRWMTAFINTPYENGGFWFGGRRKEDDPQSAGYQGHGMDCNGSINAATFLAGVKWPDGDWRRNTFHKGNHNMRYPGVQVKPDELRPGDLIDMMSSSHVRLVWDVTTRADGTRMVSWIESAGSANRVRLKLAGATLADIASDFHLINLNDPQPRGKEVK
jgi:cell wall-associated NlpC family hydrolase